MPFPGTILLMNIYFAYKPILKSQPLNIIFQPSAIILDFKGLPCSQPSSALYTNLVSHTIGQNLKVCGNSYNSMLDFQKPINDLGVKMTRNTVPRDFQLDPCFLTSLILFCFPPTPFQHVGILCSSYHPLGRWSLPWMVKLDPLWSPFGFCHGHTKNHLSFFKVFSFKKIIVIMSYSFDTFWSHR